MSSTTIQDRWPPTASFIDTLQHRREDALLEFKRQWHDLQTQQGKGEFVKDILAIANTVTEAEIGILAIGIDQTDSGSDVVGVSNPPTSETISQLLQTYTNPAPNCEVVHVTHRNGLISVVGIFWSPYGPHYAIRQVDKALDPNLVYCRRGPMVGVLRPQEHENFIRRKDVRLGPLKAADPIQIGFLEINATNCDPMGAVTIRNVSDEPVMVVRSFFDVTLVRDRRLSARISQLSQGLFRPGEVRDLKFRAQDFNISDGPTTHHVTQYENRTFDLLLTVQYRDRDGLIQQRTALLKVAG